MQMYAQTNTRTYASTNGYLSLGYGSSQYAASELPVDYLPNNTVAVFLDDLYLYRAVEPEQGIFYQFNGDQTAITYEYYLALAGEPSHAYHFTVAYDSAQPGVFTYEYFQTGGAADNGMYAAVGSQGSKLCIDLSASEGHTNRSRS